MIQITKRDVFVGVFTALYLQFALSTQGHGLTIFSILSILLGWTFIHERIHWVLGRLWSEDVSFNRTFGVPHEVNYGSPHDIPTQAFRILGVAPFIVGVVLSVSLISLAGLPQATSPSEIWLFWSITLGLLFSISPSDVFALGYPSAFQRFAADHDTWDAEVANSYIDSME